MDAERQRELAEEVHLRVWEGVAYPEEIIETLTDDPELEDDEAQWIGEEVNRVYAAKRGREDLAECDRLEPARRRPSGARSRRDHRAASGRRRHVGRDDVGETYRERGGKASGAIGYCFYHAQDVQRAILSQGLLLAFGGMTDDAAKSEEVGRRIVAELERDGFHVTWNGQKAHRITIDNLRWHKCGP